MAEHESTNNNATPLGSEQQRATDKRLATLSAQNERLAQILIEARGKIVELQKQLEDLAKPPSTYATFLRSYDDGTADVVAAGRKMRLTSLAENRLSEAYPGQEVRLNEAMAIVEVLPHEGTGELAAVKELIDDDRVLIVGRGDDERILRLSDALKPRNGKAAIRAGDTVLIDLKAGFAFERIEKSEVEELVLEEVPNVHYEDIGGLGVQIEHIRDAVELPFAHPDLYREHGLKPPKGILLYGPPGCGKTLIAKAVANSLAVAAAQRNGTSIEAATSYFLNIKGPELLNKYVGETERQIRLIFGRAREKAALGHPVVVFFDEMESLFRTRGTGLSSDVETTIVPQLLAEIDGVEQLENVIVIGASNREDMIDPAILRPGRLDVKIKIERPDAEGAREIFSKYLTTNLPIHADDVAEHGGDVAVTVDAMIQRVVEHMYAEGEENQFLEVTYASGDKEILYFKDFNSGAMIQNIVDRAKKSAIKDFLTSHARGIRVEHLISACVDEFKENEDLPNTTNPDDWARISGKKGERIVFIRTIVQSKTPSQTNDVPPSVHTVENTGPYL
ncbi:proteasome ATPase [Timonella sp. A28]|uniref:proteasome ATPase n=1 Tax=Timonella sp. A28 TaxID=3442640 RepID=UPI003EB8D32E